MGRLACLGAGVVVMLLAAHAAHAQTKPAPSNQPATTAPAASAWEVVARPGFGVAVPRAWWEREALAPRAVLFRQGDGNIVPLTDETGAPLQAGMMVEQFPTQTPLDKGIEDLKRNAARDPRLEPIGEPAVEKLTLADGTDARLLTAQFVKEGRRRSLQLKLAVMDKAGNAFVVSGFLVGGKESTLPSPDGVWGKWLRAHVTSFCLDATKVDEAPVAKAYEALPKQP